MLIAASGYIMTTAIPDLGTGAIMAKKSKKRISGSLMKIVSLVIVDEYDL